MGKWIQEQERLNKNFVSLRAWEELKTSHEIVHTHVQEYINENAKHIPQKQLAQKALSIENDTLIVFEKLNSVLKNNSN